MSNGLDALTYESGFGDQYISHVVNPSRESNRCLSRELLHNVPFVSIRLEKVADQFPVVDEQRGASIQVAHAQLHAASIHDLEAREGFEPTTSPGFTLERSTTELLRLGAAGWIRTTNLEVALGSEPIELPLRIEHPEGIEPPTHQFIMLAALPLRRTGAFKSAGPGGFEPPVCLGHYARCATTSLKPLGGARLGSQAARRQRSFPSALHNYFTSGMLDSTFLTAARSRMGLHPMAMGLPSHSTMSTWVMPAWVRSASISRRCAWSRAASATAIVFFGTRPGALSPAAWIAWATCDPLGRSARTMM